MWFRFVDWFLDRLLGWLVVLAILFALAMIVLSIQAHIYLTNQCLDDGHKEYECAGILRGGRGR